MPDDERPKKLRRKSDPLSGLGETGIDFLKRLPERAAESIYQGSMSDLGLGPSALETPVIGAVLGQPSSRIMEFLAKRYPQAMEDFPRMNLQRWQYEGPDTPAPSKRGGQYFLQQLGDWVSRAYQNVAGSSAGEGGNFLRTGSITAENPFIKTTPTRHSAVGLLGDNLNNKIMSLASMSRYSDESGAKNELIRTLKKLGATDEQIYGALSARYPIDSIQDVAKTVKLKKEGHDVYIRMRHPADQPEVFIVDPVKKALENEQWWQYKPSPQNLSGQDLVNLKTGKPYYPPD